MSEPQGVGALVGIVLAGGASSRFGADKLAAPLDGRPVLHHAVQRLATVAAEVVVVLAPAAPEPPLPDVSASLRFARDPTAYAGPLQGLVAGLATIAGGAARIALVTAGDMPRVEPLVLALLAAALTAHPAAGVAVLEAEPSAPLPMAVRVGPALAAARPLLDADRRSLRALIAAVPVTTVAAATWQALDPTGGSLRDVDVPSDL